MQTTSVLSRSRITSIDLLRGLVMIIMALDHTRDFFHVHAMDQNPLNLQTTTPMLFFTRWITHFCAPTFVFLAGTSAYLQGLRKNKKQLSSFLITRGFWLIFAEIVFINLAYFFDLSYAAIGLQVIWAIGISRIILGLFIWLPFTVILLTGLIIVFGHNMLDFYEKENSNFGIGYSLLHRFGIFPLTENTRLIVLYPFLSWTGLMMLGYCFGRLIQNSEGIQRKKLLSWLGIGVIVLFIAVRGLTVYGDPSGWLKQDNILYTIFSFVNTQKYPPSLLYMCMTIGPALLFLAFFDKARGKIAEIISVYGRVPFFYYVLHFYLIHIVSTLLFFQRGHSVQEGTHPTGMDPFFVIPGEGYSLTAVYFIWIAIVASLYPLCKWYDRYKANHKENKWLSYL